MEQHCPLILIKKYGRHDEFTWSFHLEHTICSDNRLTSGMFEQRDESTTMKNDFFNSAECHTAIVRWMNLALPVCSVWFPRGSDRLFQGVGPPITHSGSGLSPLQAEGRQIPTHLTTTIREVHNVSSSRSVGFWSRHFYYYPRTCVKSWATRPFQCEGGELNKHLSKSIKITF